MASDYLQYIAAQLGFSLEYLPKTPWPKILELIQNKEIDVLSCAAFTKERSKYLLFSNTHITFPLVIISRKDAPDIKTMQDIEGMRVALIKEISTEAALKKSQISFTPHFITSPKDALKAVSLGQADIAIENLAAASHIIDQQGYTNLKIAAPTDFDDYALAIAIRKDWPLFQSILNKSLAAISDQQHREIRQRWFSVRYEHGITFIDILKWIAFSFLLSSVVIGAIILWNRRLVRENEERRKIEVRLRESERKLSTLIGNLPGIAYRCRNENEWPMEFISDGCMDVTGFLPSEISKDAPLRYGDIIYPDDRQDVWETTQDGVKQDKHFEIEYRIVTKSGDIKWVRERGGKVFDIQTQDIYLEGFISDITQQKILADKLHQSQKMEAIGMLAGRVAHDLNNILSGIVGYPELLLQTLPKDSELRKPLEAIHDSGQRAATVVADLLTVAKGAASIREIQNLNVLIEEYLISPECEELKSLYPDVIFQTKFEASHSAISCSPVHVKKCLMNLVTNAAEAVEKDGIIMVSTHNKYVDSTVGSKQQMKTGEYVVASVRDTGMGVSDTDLEHIFEPFYSTKAMGRSGTGLGLAIVWNTMQDHNGKILIDSSEQGTRFQLYFPMSEHKVIGQAKNDQMEGLTGTNEHILVVDDDPQLRDLASQMLQTMGYKVDSVSSGELAQQFVKGNPVDLIVMDMLMEPGMNGRQTYEEILKLYPNQKAIVASGFSESDDIKAALKLGAGGFVKKPYSMVKLGRAVKEALNS